MAPICGGGVCVCVCVCLFSRSDKHGEKKDHKLFALVRVRLTLGQPAG